ncbi:MAG: hypothetical protein IAE64_01140 [Flavobacteriales bacterium]|nr:hypothetical protein [Flavobacteriales bacterium]
MSTRDTKMDLTSIYNTVYNRTKDGLKQDWDTYLADRSVHEEIDDTARSYANTLGRRVQTIYQHQEPIIVNGVMHPTQSTLYENTFLRNLCNEWRYASRRYSKSPEAIVQFFKNNLDRLRTEHRFELHRIGSERYYKPEALDWSKEKLARLLGRYQAMIDTMEYVTDSGREAVQSENPFPDVQKRTQIMLLLMLFSSEHGWYIPERSDDDDKKAVYPFIQERLAELAARLAGSEDTSKYKQAVKDVLIVYKKEGSTPVLKKTKSLVDILTNGSDSRLAQFIQGELDLLNEAL